MMEKPFVRALSHRSGVVLLTLEVDAVNRLPAVYDTIAGGGETALFHLSACKEDGSATIAVCAEDERGAGYLDSTVKEVPGVSGVKARAGLALLSVTGHSLQDNLEVQKEVWKVFTEEDVPLVEAFTSPTTLSFVVPEEHLSHLANRLHEKLFHPARSAR